MRETSESCERIASRSGSYPRNSLAQPAVPGCGLPVPQSHALHGARRTVAECWKNRASRLRGEGWDAPSATERYIGQERQAKASGVPPLANVNGELFSTDGEKSEVQNEFFASVFTGSQDSCISHIPEPCIPKPKGGNWGSKPPQPPPSPL